LAFARGLAVERTKEKDRHFFSSSAAAQEFAFPNQLTAWVKLTDLRETFPLGDNGVTECEVYGKDVGVRQREVDGSSPHARSAASTTAVLPASSD